MRVNVSEIKFKLKRKHYLTAAVVVLVALLTFVLAYKLAPWLHAINTEVRLYVDAPAKTKINICWDKTQIECLPLVPYSTTNQRIAQSDEIADLWMTELPPRPTYAIEVTFNSDIKNAKFTRLELASAQDFLFGDVHGAGVGKVQFNLDSFKLSNISSASSASDVNLIEINKGGQLKLDNDVYDGDSAQAINWSSIILVWSLLLSVFFVFAVPIYLLPHVVQNAGSATVTADRKNLSWWMFIIYGFLMSMMVLLVEASGVLLIASDPFGYLYLALGGGWFNDVRLPGYPVFLGLAFSIFNNSLNGVILLQAICLATSVVVCACALRRWIPPLASIIFVTLCLFSPAQIYWSRWILRESLFASIVLLGITVAICHFTSKKPFSDIWLIVFSVICGVAFLVRENGLLLPVALLPGLIPEMIKRIRDANNIRDRLVSIFSLSIRYGSSLVFLGIVYFTFSAINYTRYGYFQAGRHQTSHSNLVRAIYPGNSDARSLLRPGPSVRAEIPKYDGWRFYSSYIVTRQQSGGDPIYLSLFPSVFQAMGNRRSNILEAASILNNMGKEMDKLVPWKADAAGVLRQYLDILSIDAIRSYGSKISGQASLYDLQQYLTASGLHTAVVRLDEKNIESNGLITEYYSLTQGYSWYPFLLFFAFFSSIYILKWEDPVFLAPIAFVLANCIFLLITRLVSSRYIENLDILLILQSVLCLCLCFRRIKRHKLISSQANTQRDD